MDVIVDIQGKVDVTHHPKRNSKVLTNPDERKLNEVSH
jgi:hypothetical protein